MDHPAPASAPRNFAVYDPERMGKSTLFQSDRLLVGLNSFEPGQEHRLHGHAGMDKVYYVLAGPAAFPARGARGADGGGDDADRSRGGPSRHPQHRRERLLVMAILAPSP